MNDAFLSIVENRGDDGVLLVRARVKGHIEAVFPKAQVFTDQGADYFYRAFIPRELVAEVVAQRLMTVDYDNFKSSVKDKSLHDAYLNVWTVMNRLQVSKRAPRSHYLRR